MNLRQRGHFLGVHRVKSPAGVLPQAADQLDTSLPLFNNEVLIKVSSLQIDSASFHQLLNSVPQNISSQESLAHRITQIIQEHGKMHNPITHSGGVLLGTIMQMGKDHPAHTSFDIGDPIVTLISLTLTPLSIQQIHHVDIQKERIELTGHAILFESGLMTKIPYDLPLGVVLAALDVCGAPAQVNRHVQSGDSVLILGLGKAGRSMALMAYKRGAFVYGIDKDADAVGWCQEYIPGRFAKLDAQNPLKVLDWVESQTNKQLIKKVFHATPLSNTEMSAVLSCQQGGEVLFFGMNTSFQKVVLGAEGIGRDIHLEMGNGFVPGHDLLMLNLLREHAPLRDWFEKKFK